jgi:cellulose biosynthesis protein BcsQ
VFNISKVKVAELATIADCKPPVISRMFKTMEEPWIEKKNNRITGISPELIENYFRKRGFNDLFKTTIILSNSTVGGTGKTSTVLAMAGSLRRITDRSKAVVMIDCDSQASATQTALGFAIPDDKPVLLDYFEGRASLDEVLHVVSNPEENIFIIGSNLNNIYMDKHLNSPKAIKDSMAKLFKELISKFGEGVRILIDTPPQLSTSTSSTVCGISSMIKEGYDLQAHYIIPIRPDSYSLKGASISVNEKTEILETFDLPDIKTTCFLTAFDKRMKVGVEIMRQALQDDKLQNLLSPVMVRYSSEISKASLDHKNIFSDSRATPATKDYMDLTLYVLGYEGKQGHS